MGLDFFKWLMPKKSGVISREVITQELCAAAQEFQIRELCFWTCVNMIANAMARCEFRTYRNFEEIQEREYYLWNFEPNANQNSTAFIHKLIAKLYADNEALIIGSTQADGTNRLVVADSFELPEDFAVKQHEYSGVVVGNMEYRKTFREPDVLHLRLNHTNMRPVIDGMYQSYYRLATAAIKNFEYNHGQHWKVPVSQLASGDPNFKENFAKMIQDQVKPFFDSNGAILPEFEGYKYEDVGQHGGKDSRDIKNIIEDIFDFTARAMLVPAVLVNGKVEGTKDANTRFLTNCIDPLCDQLQEEITRKRYGYENWKSGNFLRVDSSSIIHFDIFENAANIEKLVGSGAYTINDVRRAANEPRINEPWADAHYMTLNIANVNEATRQLESQEGGSK